VLLLELLADDRGLAAAVARLLRRLKAG